MFFFHDAACWGGFVNANSVSVFPHPTAIIAARRRGMLAARLCRRSTGIMPIYPAGLGGAHQDSRAGCQNWCSQGPIHPKYALWGYSLAILQVAPFWWRCPAVGNQGLPKHGEVWRYRLGSGSYSRNDAWQMALGGFANSPVEFIDELSVREHKRLFSTTLKSSPRRVRNHHQLGPVSLALLLEALTR